MTVGIVLPPREGFSAGAVGAIGLLVRRLVRAGAEGVVVGAPLAEAAFPDVSYRPAPPGWGLSGTARYAAGVARVLRRLQPSLIEVHNRPEVALYLARRFAAPVVLLLNNDPQGMRGARTAAERARLLGRLARVTASSDWLRGRLLEGLAPPARPPVTLFNCIDLPAPRLPKERLIVFAGRVVADKGVDLFVAACAEVLPKLPGWRAEIVGADRFAADSADTPFLRALRPQAEAAGVILRGHQPHAGVLDAMARAAIVAVPSRWEEPFGLTALEAMACGAALVVTRRGGLPEVAGDVGVYVEATARSLAEAFLALASEPARCTALGEAGQRRAELFAAPLAAQALLKLRGEAHHLRV